MAEMIITSTVISCFFFKQKTAYEMRISDWSSDVCSSDLEPAQCRTQRRGAARRDRRLRRGVAVEDRVELRIAVGGLAEHIGVGVGRRRGEQAEGRAHRLIAGDGEREIVAEQAELVDGLDVGESAAQSVECLGGVEGGEIAVRAAIEEDRKSTRLNSSH